MSCQSCPASAAMKAFSGLRPCCSAASQGGEQPCQSAEDPNLGKILDGRYVLCECLQPGLRGTIYRARSLNTPKQFAIKIIPPGPRGPTAIDFPHSVRNPHLLDVFDIFTFDDDHVAVVMPLIQGETLAKRVRRLGPLDLATTVVLARQIASALLSLHLRGVVHGDLHPGNIVLETLPSGELFCHLLNASWGRTPSPSVTLEDPEDPFFFISPEEVGSSTATAASDVYSFGALLYFMLTATSPFFETHRLRATEAILRGLRADSLRGLNGLLPRPLKRLMFSLLQRDPSLRPGPVQEIIAALDNLEVPATAPAGHSISCGETIHRPTPLAAILWHRGERPHGLERA